MKESRVFVGLVLVLALVLVLLDGLLPRRFSWEPTYAHDDHNPLGCAVFDDVVSASLNHSYQVIDRSFADLLRDTTLDSTATFLQTDENLTFHPSEKQALLELVRRGHRVLLAGSYFSLSDTLDYRTGNSPYRSFSPADLTTACDTLCWTDTSGGYPPARFVIGWHPSHTTLVLPDTTRAEILLQPFPLSSDTMDVEAKAVAVRYRIGRGQLLLVGYPVLFTNYAVLNSRYAPLTFRLLSQIDSGPVCRIESGYSVAVSGGHSPLRYLLSRPPLRWALYTALLALVAFMFFSARRRQRVIPECFPPANRNLEFVRLVGSLYFQQKDYTGLIRRKYSYFRDFIHTRTGIDPDVGHPDPDTARRIAEVARVEPESVEQLLLELSEVLHTGSAVDERQMKSLADRMNILLKNVGKL